MLRINRRLFKARFEANCEVNPRNICRDYLSNLLFEFSITKGRRRFNRTDYRIVWSKIKEKLNDL